MRDQAGDREPFWVRHPVISLAALLLAVVLAGWGAYAVKVALSPVKGAGDVIIKQNDATTVINTHKELAKRYEGLPAACANIAIAREAKEGDPGNRILAANYTAARQHYLTLVAEYNAATQALTAANALGDLPARVDASACAEVNR